MRESNPAELVQRPHDVASESLTWFTGRRRDPVETAPDGRFRRRIIDEADNVARLYLAGKRLGQPATREQKEIIEGILAADYEGRRSSCQHRLKIDPFPTGEF